MSLLILSSMVQFKLSLLILVSKIQVQILVYNQVIDVNTWPKKIICQWGIFICLTNKILWPLSLTCSIRCWSHLHEVTWKHFEHIKFAVHLAKLAWYPYFLCKACYTGSTLSNVALIAGGSQWRGFSAHIAARLAIICNSYAFSHRQTWEAQSAAREPPEYVQPIPISGCQQMLSHNNHRLRLMISKYLWKDIPVNAKMNAGW